MSNIKTIAFAAVAIATAIGAGYVYLEKRKQKNNEVVDTAKEFNIPDDDFTSGTPMVSEDNTLNVVFDSIKTTVPFNPDWKNGTGYFDFIKGAKFDLPTHTVVKCIDDHGRKMVIIVEEDGNHTVFFQRYSDRNDYVCAHSLDSKGHYSGQSTGLMDLELSVESPDNARALLDTSE